MKYKNVMKNCHDQLCCQLKCFINTTSEITIDGYYNFRILQKGSIVTLFPFDAHKCHTRKNYR